MTHDVFISYASEDAEGAKAVCRALEDAGVQCWIAPRDVVPGTSYGAAIVRAIGGARVFVLVFSKHSNNSVFVDKEVERAVSGRLPILPFRLEDCAPSDSLDFFLAGQHWLDAYPPPLESHLGRLVDAVKSQLPAREPADAAAPAAAAAAVDLPASASQEISAGVGAADQMRTLCGKFPKEPVSEEVVEAARRRASASRSPHSTCPILLVLEEEFRDRSLEITKDVVHIGRAGGNDLTIPHASVSTRHCCIRREAEGFVIIDSGSTNGTWVTGQQLERGERRVLRDGDVIELGHVRLLYDADWRVGTEPTGERTSTMKVGRREISGLPPLHHTAKRFIAAPPTPAPPAEPPPPQPQPQPQPPPTPAPCVLRLAVPDLQAPLPQLARSDTVKIPGSAPPPDLDAAAIAAAHEAAAAARSRLGPGGACPTLIVLGGQRRGQSVQLDASVVHVGRAAENDWTLDDESVSARHCSFYRDGTGFAVMDSGSTNGMAVNGRVLAPGEKCALSNADVIRVGDIQLLYDSDWKISAGALPGTRIRFLPGAESRHSTASVQRTVSIVAFWLGVGMMAAILGTILWFVWR